MQIVQTPKTVVMLLELFHVFRVIQIDAKHPEDLEASFMGDSVGRWEGDTLVVDVIGFNDKTWLADRRQHEEQQMSAALGLREWLRQARTLVAE